jgi:TonB family protein
MLPPKPLATPLPVFPKAGHGDLKISFVIGTDGRLHKLAIVNSAGRAADSKGVNALRQWRYEPAMCNGVPTEAEGTVEFPAMAQ